MVNRNLQSAAQDIGTVVTDMDIVTWATAATGLGTGLFAAEFASAWVMDRVQGQGDAVGFLADIGSRLGVAFGFAQGANATGSGPLIETLLLLAAFGAVSSAGLRVIESVAEAAAGNLSSPVKQSMSQARSASGSASSRGSVRRVNATQSRGSAKKVRASAGSASANGSGFGNRQPASSF